jgi:hypothetical protein
LDGFRDSFDYMHTQTLGIFTISTFPGIVY